MKNLSHKDTKKLKMCLCFVSLVLCLFFSACVPARVPPQLAYTPGPPVKVAGHLYRSTLFTVEYPPGWDAITSAASSPPSAIFVAPDHSALITLGLDIEEVPALAGADTVEIRRVILGGTHITAVLRTPDQALDNLLPLFEQLVTSIRQT